MLLLWWTQKVWLFDNTSHNNLAVEVWQWTNSQQCSFQWCPSSSKYVRAASRKIFRSEQCRSRIFSLLRRKVFLSKIYHGLGKNFARFIQFIQDFLMQHGKIRYICILVKLECSSGGQILQGFRCVMENFLQTFRRNTFLVKILLRW